jgi:hypothetical protein
MPDDCYQSAEDAESGETLRLDAPIHLPAYGGRWARCLK